MGSAGSCSDPSTVSAPPGASSDAAVLPVEVSVAVLYTVDTGVVAALAAGCQRAATANVAAASASASASRAPRRTITCRAIGQAHPSNVNLLPGGCAGGAAGP